MKKIFILRSLLVTAVSATLLLAACKKKDKEEDKGPDETGQVNQDNNDAKNENDAAMNDINSVISDYATLRGKSASGETTSSMTGTICGMSIDTAGLATSGSIKLNFNGITCSNRTRTGSIRLTMQNYTQGKRWKDLGCVIKVDYQGYKVVRASDRKSIQLDGTQNYTNLSGGTWWELLIVKTQSSLVTTVTGTNLKVTFSDGKSAMYNINRKVTYTYPNNILTCTAEGIGSNLGISNLKNYGTTRDGDAFASQVNVPIVWNLTCGAWAPVAGDINITVATKGYGLRGLFGVDTGGNPISVGANQCPYGWKLEWTYNSKTYNKVFGYN